MYARELVRRLQNAIEDHGNDIQVVMVDYGVTSKITHGCMLVRPPTKYNPDCEINEPHVVLRVM